MMTTVMKKLPVYVALDLDEEKKVLSLAEEVSSYVEGFKIGPRVGLKNGSSIISKLKSYGKVFLDFKFFDIPSTMLSSVQAAFDLGVDLLTVHALAGEESLRQLAKLEARLRKQRDFRILAVTIITSFSNKVLPPLVRTQSIFSHVEDLSDLVIKSGLSGLVCSGSEVAYLRKKYPDAYLLTPGIRFHLDSAQDQKRISTPQEAIKAGASALVMGRSIYGTADPIGACTKLQKELNPFL